ncbi:MAG: extracellular solute-binding protein [Bacteroidota bacterium]
MALLLLPACRTEPQRVTDDGRKIVRFFILLISTKQVEYFNWAEEEFERLNPDIDLQIEQFPGSSLKDYEVKLRLRFASGQEPDAFGTHENVVTELAKLGLLSPAPQDVVSLNERTINEMARRSPYTDGVSYGLTADAVWTAFYYNKDLYREVGLDPERPPQTWEEWLDHGEQLTERTPDGRITRAGISLRKTGYKPGIAEKWMTFVYAAGGRGFTEDGTRALFNSDAGRAALEFYRQVLFERQIDATYLEGDQQGFGQQVAATFVRESHVIRWLGENYPDLDFGVAQIPAQTTSYSAGGGYVYTVPKASPHQEEAWRWIKFLHSQDAYARLLDLGGVVPTVASFAEQPEYRDDPHLSAFLNQPVHESESFPNVSRAMGILGTYIEKFCYGQIEAQEMLDRAEEDVNAILLPNRIRAERERGQGATTETISLD